LGWAFQYGGVEIKKNLVLTFGFLEVKQQDRNRHNNFVYEIAATIEVEKVRVIRGSVGCLG
jgi:hypothetical protein